MYCAHRLCSILIHVVDQHKMAKQNIYAWNVDVLDYSHTTRTIIIPGSRPHNITKVWKTYARPIRCALKKNNDNIKNIIATI